MKQASWFVLARRQHPQTKAQPQATMVWWVRDKPLDPDLLRRPQAKAKGHVGKVQEEEDPGQGEESWCLVPHSSGT